MDRFAYTFYPVEVVVEGETFDIVTVKKTEDVSATYFALADKRYGVIFGIGDSLSNLRIQQAAMELIEKEELYKVDIQDTLDQIRKRYAEPVVEEYPYSAPGAVVPPQLN